jgi:hypothetical protein
VDATELIEAERRVREQAHRYRTEQAGVVDSVYLGNAPLTELGNVRLDQLRQDLIQAGLRYDEEAEAMGVPVVDRFCWQSHLGADAVRARSEDRRTG